MIIETLLLGSAAAYLSARRVRNKKSGSQLIPLQNNGKALRKKSLFNKLVKKPSKVEHPQAKDEENEKSVQHYFQMSIASVAVSGAAFMTTVLQPLSIAFLIYLCLPIFQNTLERWKVQREIGHELLVTLLILLGFVSAQFFALATIFFLYYLGKKLLARTQKHSKAMLADLFAHKPETVWRLQDGVELETPLDQVHVNDLLVINTGDVIPIDGTIVDGMAVVDQHALTGESQPMEKLQHSAVFASTQVMSGRIIVRVDKTGSDTTVSKIGDMLKNSADYKVSVLSKGEMLSNQMAKPLILLSAAVTPFLGAVGASAVLNSTFGSRLQLTAPMSVLNHLNIATKKGILVKDGRALESLVHVDTVLFDKTGTLTEEQPTVKQIYLCCEDDEDYNEHHLLAEAAAAENKLDHPIARAIVAKSDDHGLSLPTLDDTDFQIGLGVTVKIKDATVLVGSERFMHQNDIEIPESIQKVIKEIHSYGHSIIFLAKDGKLKGALELEPTVRPEIKAMVAQLRARGVEHIAIVSGDQEAPTKSMAEHLGMDSYFAEVMPKDKASIVANLQEQGRKVCFIGDGVNDALAIKKADVSISIDGATHAARDLAQVVFMDGTLKRLVDLFDIARSLEDNLQDGMVALYGSTILSLAGALFLNFNLLTTVAINGSALLLALHKTTQDTVERNRTSNNKKLKLADLS